jgi:xanthine dehydrogenase accessory factor
MTASDEPLAQLERLREGERRVALATLIATSGTTPKKAGATMWVGEHGRVLGSVTIGGCVDARVIEEADQVIATGKPSVVALELGDEDAWDLGMTCGGSVRVRIEPLDLTAPDDPVHAAVEAIAAARRRGARAISVMSLDGSAGRLVVTDAGATGTLGDASLDAAARDRAQAMLATAGAAARIETATGAFGERELFMEMHAPPATLTIFGATHVAMPLVAMAKVLGFHTTVVDGRDRFATRERFPDADELVVGMPSEIAESLALTPSSCVVLVAHDYKYDLPVLRAVLASDAGYIGLLGSARRGRAILDFLAGEGVPADALVRVRVPIGLDIGGATAEEIALSILAEAIAVRHGRPGTPMRDRPARPARGGDA